MTRSSDTGFTLEDPLTYLPRKPVIEYARRRVIYDAYHPNDRLYLVIRGRVKITTTADEGFDTISRIVTAEGLFGEGALVGAPMKREAAVALDQVNLMAWTRAEIEQHIDREPHLGLALSQYLVRECIELQDRIESMAVYKTPERVTLAFLQLAKTLGTPLEDGSVRIASLTHQTIAEFVGTSREIVTFQMNRLRRMGMLRYSRKHIDIQKDALAEALRSQGISLATSGREAAWQAAG
jgi:CRP/FNR family transcriptional regulator, cyclic AMP receptor protein